MSNISVAVLGAGMVGVATALALQKKGFQVTLLDSRAPGEETSYGNAGVIARSSLMPFNNPSLFGNLPTLLKNQSASFRYRPPIVDFERTRWYWWKTHTPPAAMPPSPRSR